jgi:thiamine biosynthesis protein ThiS
MRAFVNGEPRALEPGATVADVLRALEPGGQREPSLRGIAVALDGEVVPRGSWSQTIVPADGRIEVLGDRRRAMNDPLVIAGRELTSRLILGSGGFANHELLRDACAAAGAELSTVALRRIGPPREPGPGRSILDVLEDAGVEVLPNTAGEDRMLLPDAVERLGAAETLVADGRSALAVSGAAS